MVVCDATQLQRSIVLATQALDLEIPIIVVLNMSDILAKESLNIQTDLLSQRLDVPVVALSALTGQGIDQLIVTISPNILPAKKHIFVPPPDLAYLAEDIKSCLKTDNDYLAFQALLQPDEFLELSESCRLSIRQKVKKQQIPLFISDEMLQRHDKTEAICDTVLKQAPTESEKRTNQIDAIVLHKIGGYLIFIAILLLVFQAIFSWASYPMDWIEGIFNTLADWLHANLPATWLTSLLADGIVAGLGGIAIFVPQIALLFFFIALLEETGYMARVMFCVLLVLVVGRWCL